jgi:hypothetical protein
MLHKALLWTESTSQRCMPAGQQQRHVSMFCLLQNTTLPIHLLLCPLDMPADSLHAAGNKQLAAACKH